MITRFVNTASSAGGDGTTNATTGANRAYASLNEAEAAEQQVLSEPIEFICQGTAADTTAVTIDGWTTSDTNYITIHTTQANRHDGKWNTGKYRLEVTDTASGWALLINENYTRVDGLQIKRIITSGMHAHGVGSGSGGDYVYISNNIVWGFLTAGNTYNGAIPIYATGYVWNNIAYGFDTGKGYGIRQYNSGNTLYAYNNTCYDNTKGFLEDQGPIIAKNNISYNNTTDFDGTFTSSDYNFSKDDTAPGANSIHGTTDSKTPDFVNTGSGTEDFHLQSTSDAIDVGVSDPGSGLFSDDIDGDTRSGSWDIGADEYVAAGGGNVKSSNKVAFANLKSKNKVAKADIKSINDITAN